MFDTYIINLDRKIENFYKLQNIYRNIGIYPKRVSAVDASKNEHLEHKEQINKLCLKACPDVAMAISISHKKVAEEFLKTGKEYCLVLEDDAYPREDIPNMIGEILKIEEKVPRDWDFILLYCQGVCKKGSIQTNWLSGSAAAYIMSRRGAIKTINTKVKFQVDMDRAGNKNYNIYKSPYNYFITDETTSDNRNENINFLTKIKIHIANFLYSDPEHMDYSIMAKYPLYKNSIDVDKAINIATVLLCIFIYIIVMYYMKR